MTKIINHMDNGLHLQTLQYGAASRFSIQFSNWASLSQAFKNFVGTWLLSSITFTFLCLIQKFHFATVRVIWLTNMVFVMNTLHNLLISSAWANEWATPGTLRTESHHPHGHLSGAKKGNFLENGNTDMANRLLYTETYYY